VVAVAAVVAVTCPPWVFEPPLEFCEADPGGGLPTFEPGGGGGALSRVNFPEIVGFAHWLIGGGAGAPGMSFSASNANCTRFFGNGEYPSNAAFSWPAHTRRG